jgi:hypothetical protein
VKQVSSFTYQAIGYVGDRSDFTVTKAVERLRSSRRESKLDISNVSDSGFRISFGDWTLKVNVSDADWVASEAQERAEEFRSYQHSAAVAVCRRMVEVCTYDEDSEVLHVNDYLLVIETLGSSFRDFYVLEMMSGRWFDSDEGPR